MNLRVLHREDSFKEWHLLRKKTDIIDEILKNRKKRVNSSEKTNQ